MNRVSIDSDNGLWTGRRQAIIWTNAGILLIQTLGRNVREILSEIYTFSLKNAIENVVCQIGGHFVQGEMSQENPTAGIIATLLKFYQPEDSKVLYEKKSNMVQRSVSYKPHT